MMIWNSCSFSFLRLCGYAGLAADELPEDLQGNNLEVPMAQHLLAAADMYQLTRLRRICERRLCESVDVETAATTLALAEQNHAEVMKRIAPRGAVWIGFQQG